MRNQQYISLFFLFAVLLIVAHSIIPHHHHTDSFFAHFLNYCPVSDADHDNLPDSPLHCHAFNDLNLFKETQFDISLLTSPEIDGIVPDIILLQSFSGINNKKHITLPNNPHKNHHFIIPGPLRAPPALS